MVSFSGANADSLVPQDAPFRVYQDAKIDADDHLRSSALDWTVLGPGALTDDRGTGRVNPDATSRDGDESPRELVAQVATAVVDDPRSHGATLVFGAEAARRGAEGLPVAGPLALLAGVTLGSLALLPFAAGAALRVNLR